MSVGKLILFGLLGLVVAEAAVFLMIAWTFGSFTAVVALISTSVLGVAVLTRMGRRLAGRVADILSQRDFAAAGARSGGFLTTLAGLLLLLPGFITDLVGLLLLRTGDPAMSGGPIPRSAGPDPPDGFSN